ncbi:MAG TPA: glycoside hydrolase family 65 protein [Candidatus Fournierella pullicola]|uniref:Glycoside hydrolase family 65 protein n=1 Tax=Candidatus Allofournierella pullicola TaxID=2838596 RepID=A0A9D2AEK1_9FIRM|nr:glycoside hydrolase family 65 protein [Candidatus Fournierella pullicola]
MNTIICEEGLRPEQAEFLGSKLLMGNGYVGCRGTLEEYRAEQLTALTMAGLFDQKDGGWREPVNAPNPFWVQARFNGTPLSVLDTQPVSHRQWVETDCACQGRESDFSAARVTARRFAHREQRHILALRYTVQAAVAGTCEMKIAPDLCVWDINGPHLEQTSFRPEGGALRVTAVTSELGTAVDLAQLVSCSCGRTELRGDGFYITAELAAGQTLTADIYAALYKSTDPDAADPVRAVQSAARQGFDALLASHRRSWEQLWRQVQVKIEGDEQADLALRYSMYLLLVSTPFHTDRVAIPARGLSGQVYKGAMFWDTELYMLPMFLASLPQVARNLVRYRVNTLDGARAKAREYGYRGAFYQWESQEDGRDGCTEYNINDIFTGRPLRTYFRDKQIHISADVAFGLWEYFRWTGDESLLLEGGAEVLFECARFLYSWSYYKPEKKRYEMLDVTGADEYHERVNNDFYTNVMTKKALEAFRGAADYLQTHAPDRLEELLDRLNFREDLPAILEFERELYVPSPDPKTGLIEQYDGHFRMEDLTPDELRARILRPNEYLGSPVGLAVQTQVIKQADVCLVTALFPQEYPPEVRRANFRYYEPRTEHGSSLSGCIYALAAVKCGLAEYAYPYFLQAATLDLAGAYKRYVGDLYIGGTHPAANGGSWMVAVRGFGGLSLQQDGLHLDPALPQGWSGLSFPLCWQGLRCRVHITQDTVRVEADRENPGPLRLQVCALACQAAPGETVELPCPKEAKP